MLTLHDLRKQASTHLNLNNGVLVLAVVITLSWAWGTVHAIQRNFVLQQQVDSLQQEVALIELENQTLEFQKSYYSTPEFLELSARQQLNKALPGEKVIVLPANKVPPANLSVEDLPLKNIKDRSNFDQWIYFLFANKNS